MYIWISMHVCDVVCLWMVYVCMNDVYICEWCVWMMYVYLNGICVCMNDVHVCEWCVCTRLYEWCTYMWMMCVCTCLYVRVYMNGVCMCVGTYATECLWRSEDSFQLYVGSGAPALICSVCRECLQPLSHAASPRLINVTLDGNSFWWQLASSCTVALASSPGHSLNRLSALRSPEVLAHTSLSPAFWILLVLREVWLLDNSFTLANIAPALNIIIYHCCLPQGPRPGFEQVV